MRVLIADDNTTTRKTLQELLLRHGHNVCGEAENGLEVVTKTIDLKPDVVILDLAMPYADGLTAARRISDVFPGLPMILYTLHSLPQLEMEAKKNGVHCVVSKTESMNILSFLDGLKDPHGLAVGNRKADTGEQLDVTIVVAEESGPSAHSPESFAEPDDLEEAS